MVAAIPVNWLDENSNLTSNSYAFFEEKSLQKIAQFGKTNKAVYTLYNFLRETNKIQPMKQQLKWCEILQMFPDSTDWKKIYESIYFATNKSKLRSFRNRLNLRSIVTNVQLCG